MNNIHERLLFNLGICRKHKARLSGAYNKMLGFIPLTADTLSNLNDDEIEHIDQYIFRFSKLQDSIGSKLFRVVLEILGEDVSNKSFIDIFNRLEQLEIIHNYDLWLELRNISNELAHDYEDNPKLSSEKINLMHNYMYNLTKYLDNIETYMLSQGFLIEK